MFLTPSSPAGFKAPAELAARITRRSNILGGRNERLPLNPAGAEAKPGKSRARKIRSAAQPYSRKAKIYNNLSRPFYGKSELPAHRNRCRWEKYTDKIFVFIIKSVSLCSGINYCAFNFFFFLNGPTGDLKRCHHFPGPFA